jgi:multiple sugar transport system substrate-binding protein
MIKTKNRAKIVTTSLVGVALAASVAACGGSAKSGSSAGVANGSSGAKVTLVLANSQWLDPDRGKALWSAMQQFEKVDPNVTVKQEAAPGPTIGTQLTTELGAGGGPDVMMIQDNLFESFVQAKYLSSLPASVTQGVTLNATNSGADVAGQRLGVAWQQAPFGLMYNKALLAKAGVAVPTTPAALIAAAKQVHFATGAIGFGDQSIAVSTGSWLQQIDSWTYGYGGSWEANGRLTIDTPQNVAGVTAFAQVAKAGVMQSEGYNTIIGSFTQGQVAMLTDCGCGAIGAALGGVIKSTDIGVAQEPTPQNIGFDQQLYVSVNKFSKHQAAAQEFVKWLISPAGQDALRSASGPDTLATDVPFSAAYAAANPWAQQVADLGKTARSTLIPGYELQTTQIMQIVVNHIQAIVVSGVDPAKALAQAASEVASQVK